MDFDLITRFILVFFSLFVIVEPFGAVPSFLSLTKNYTVSDTKRIALRASIFGAAVLIFFSIFGTWLFRFLQIDMSAFRAAGGALLFLTALDMLRGKNQTCRCSADELNAITEREDVSLVPVAIPMLSGPGAMTSVVVFSTDHNTNHLLHFAVIVLAILITFIISYFVLSSSIKIKTAIGKSGITVVERIMGLLLAAISLQFVVNGLTALVKQYWV